MKHVTFFAATVLMLLCSFSVSLSAQKTATWKGGKPGRTTDWTCDANWKEGKMPNEFSQVIIPSDVAFYPVITDEVPTIDALLLEGAATLTLKEDARLSILNATGLLGGMTIYGSLFNEGILEVNNSNLQTLAIKSRPQ